VCELFYIDLAAVTYMFEDRMDCSVSIFFLSRKFRCPQLDKFQMAYRFRRMANGTKILLNEKIVVIIRKISHEAVRIQYFIRNQSINMIDQFLLKLFFFVSAHVVFVPS